MEGSTVSRETLGESVSGAQPRTYRSGFRTAKAECTAGTIVAAALALVAEGNFRPTLQQVARRARVGANRVNYHFGYIHLLYRVVAREHTEAVAKAARLPASLSPAARAELVWVIMVGELIAP